MNNRKISYIVLSAVTALMAVLVLFGYYYEDSRPFYLCVGTGEAQLTVNGWENGDCLYFFLPSYSDNENTAFCLRSFSRIELDDVQIRNRMSLDDIEMNRPYRLSSNGKPRNTVVFMRSSRLPTINISTASGHTAFLERDKEYNEQAEMAVVLPDGGIEYSGMLEWISGRGNGTWLGEKKPWSLKLPESTSLLGMSPSQKWVLMANMYDISDGLRNYLAYNMAESIGCQYTSAMKFADVYMNNEYMGTYLLAEKIETLSGRIDIGDLDSANMKANGERYEVRIRKTGNAYVDGSGGISFSELDSPEDISGGYILERNYGEKLFDKPCICLTAQGEGFVVRVPESVSREEAEYIAGYMQHLENVIRSEDYTDAASGKTLDEVIDLESWVLKYLVDEVSMNEGAGATSCYFYKKQGDDRIYAGPVWDYDKSFGNCEAWISPEGLTYCMWHPESSDWWKRLYGFESANKLIRDYYRQRVRPYLTEAADSYLEEWAGEISESYEMNMTRWGSAMLPYLPTAVEQPKNLDEAVDYIKEWIKARTDFLDSAWTDGTEYCSIVVRVPGAPPNDAVTVVRGQCVSTTTPLLGLELNSGTWLNSVTGERFDADKPIYEDMFIYREGAQQYAPVISEEPENESRADIIRRKLMSNSDILVCMFLTGVLMLMLLVTVIKDIRFGREGGAGKNDR